MSEPPLCFFRQHCRGQLCDFVHLGPEREEDGQVVLVVADQHRVADAGQLVANRLLQLKRNGQTCK